MKKIINFIYLLILLIIVFFSIKFIKHYVLSLRNIRGNDRFELFSVEKGSINKMVIATGTINPVNIVKVGAQITGIVDKLYVDYNDDVKKDQILAVLDTRILKESIKEIQSLIKQKEAQLKLQKLNYERNLELHKNNYISKAEFDTAETNYIYAKEAYNADLAVYNKRKTELSYATIKSPVNGKIIERKISQGQTVASGLSVQELFYIAEDLTKMQIEVSVPEADIMSLKVGQNVVFTVDSYKNKIFNGKIQQIRLSPFFEQSVVIYNVVVSVDNQELLLLPGMTAYVSVLVEQKENVKRIKNSTLAFKPDKKLLKDYNLIDITQDSHIMNILSKNINNTVIYVFRDGKIIPTVVTKGLSDISYTEIIGGNLNIGDHIILNDTKKLK